MRPFLVIAAFAAMTAFAAAAQQMYKWVDEKGVTHYTDAPPPDGKANKIDIHPTPPSGPVPPPVDYKQKEMDSRVEKVQKEQQEKKDAVQEANEKAIKKGRCVEAQRQLQILSTQRPVFNTDAKGDKNFLDDDKRQAEIDRWQERAKTYCEA
ncbi:MAG TPA: DUF4124 domain-containing protein [Usitatibacter sp.]|jgi:hypothetical protein|nr:DUF4124 domain-containing protein [Usitatibacter sp.]